MNASFEATPRLFGKVFEVERAHRPFQADMQFGDVTFADGVDTHLVKDALLVKGGDVLEVARKAIETFRQDNLHTAASKRRQHSLIARAERRCS